jgi:hypothetical protein
VPGGFSIQYSGTTLSGSGYETMKIVYTGASLITSSGTLFISGNDGNNNVIQNGTSATVLDRLIARAGTGSAGHILRIFERDDSTKVNFYTYTLLQARITPTNTDANFTGLTYIGGTGNTTFIRPCLGLEIVGASGTSGSSGSSGSAGSSGSSGQSGAAGSSGTSGSSGQSGAAGSSGTSGSSGQSGAAGSSGTSGSSGQSGAAGSSGTSGTRGSSGTSGSSGQNGAAGSSGSSGQTGGAGSSGSSGQTGGAGSSGTSGTSPSAAAYVAKAGDTMTGTLRFTDSTNGIYKSGDRLTIRSESTDNVANFANYGLYLPVLSQTAGLYVESPIEARTGLRIGSGAASGTITVGADTAATANRLAQRDSNGDIAVRELVLNVAVQDFTPSSMVAIYPTTNQAVKVTASGARAFLSVPTRTGGDASGTWGINITGASASSTDALRITFNDGPRDLSNRLPTTLTRSVNWDFVGSGTVGGTGNYAGVMSFTPWTGTTASTGDSSYQLAFMNETGINGSGLPGLRIRKGIDSTWGSWYTLLHASNFNSYALPLSGGTVTGVADFGSTGGATNQGIGIRYQNYASGYGRIRFYQDDSNHQTIHAFASNWQSGTLASASSGAININGQNGVTFGGWNVPDAYITTGGSAWFRYDVTAYSDSRVKENVLVIDNAIQRIKSISGVTFTRNDREDKDQRHAGVIAQEVLKVLPEVVTQDSEGMYSVAYGNMAGLFIEAIKEQQTQIEDQGLEIRRLKSLIGSILGRSLK